MTGLNEETIGDELRLKRLKLGLSMNVVSERVGISENYLSLIERGKRKNIDNEILINLAKTYNFDVTYIFKRFNKIPPTLLEELNRYKALDETLLKISLDGKLNEDQKERLYDQFKKLYDEAIGVDE